jgi:hypothetical protein
MTMSDEHRVDTYRRQTGRPTLTPRQRRRVEKKRKRMEHGSSGR